MPSSAVRTFTDPDDYAASLRATSLELAITASGRFSGAITRIDLHGLWMQRFSESLPQIGYSSVLPGRAVFRSGPALARISCGTAWKLGRRVSCGTVRANAF